MLKLSCFQPIQRETVPGTFDLCQVGDLREPISQKPIRKRLTVRTTSKELHQNLHDRKCNEKHDHYQIAGSTKVHGQSMPVSQLTELYPRKFARQIIQCLRRDKSKSLAMLAADAEDHPTKRRRLSQKSSLSQIQLMSDKISWEDIMRQVDKEAPRVGPQVVTQGLILQAVQQMCPNHHVHHLVLCRGMDRMVGPNLKISPGVAPLRKFIGIRRRFEEVVVEDTWEPWENLPARKLRRPCASSRCGLTVFARPESPPAEPEIQGLKRKDTILEEEPAREKKSIRIQGSESHPMPNEVEMPEEAPSRAPLVEEHQSISQLDMRHAIDLVADKHGAKMLALTPEERSRILKVHKNMGHPNASKLKLFCQQMGCQPHIIDALEDIRCSTCLETKSPEIAKPSAIHSSLDFGDVIGMDGVKWTNKEGQQFFFYHFVDQGTTFHAATLAASHSTQDAIRALTQGWVSWAGPPGTLVVDAGTEFGTEGFHSFLQERDIKLRMIAPEAHWQNARVERHGGILQAILSKMDQEKPIQTTEDMEAALSFATQTKNKWSRHKGYPPELLVLGKLNKSPGSITSDSSNASLDLAMQESPEGIQFREKLAVRERARKALSEVDNSQALRRALHQRSRPQRSVFHPGDWIMAWRKDSQWFGPLKVIGQEDKNVIWAVLGNKLFRIAPEHVRPLSAVEEVQQSKNSNPVDVKTMLEQLRSGNTRYIDLPFETEIPSNRSNVSVNEERSSEQPDLEPEVIGKEDKSFSGSDWAARLPGKSK